LATPRPETLDTSASAAGPPTITAIDGSFLGDISHLSLPTRRPAQRVPAFFAFSSGKKLLLLVLIADLSKIVNGPFCISAFTVIRVSQEGKSHSLFIIVDMRKRANRGALKFFPFAHMFKGGVWQTAKGPLHYCDGESILWGAGLERRLFNTNGAL
jgi:hypothetical protein